jgi:ABC-type dipeptide/oligopeptide/nickel transport system permease subunit
MREFPAWVRLFVLGMGWGAACGIASAAAFVIARVVVVGAGGDNAYQLLVGVPLEGFFACYLGAIVGLLLGCVTGLVAGLVLTAMVHLTTTTVACFTTIAVVLVLQALAGMVILGMPRETNLWVCALAPAITVVPMTYVVLQQSRITRLVAHEA